MARHVFILLLVHLLLAQFPLSAQPRTAVDSLLEMSEVSQEPPEIIITRLSQSMLQSGEAHDRARLHDRIAHAYQQLAVYDSASVHAWHVLRLAPEDNALRSRAYALLGYVAFQSEAWSRSAELYRNAERLFTLLGDKQGMLESLVSQARADLKLQFAEDALNKYERAKALSVELRDESLERQLVFEMAAVFGLLGRYRDAEDYLNRSLVLNAGDTVSLAGVHRELGKLYAERAEARQAVFHFKKALALTHQTDPFPVYLSLATFYTHYHSMDTALRYADSAEVAARQSANLVYLRDLYSVRYTMAEVMRDTAQAYLFLLKFNVVNDSVKTIEAERKVRNVRHELFLGASEASVRTAELEARLAESSERSTRNQKTLTLLATGLGVASAIFLALWYFTWRRAREKIREQEAHARDLQAKNSKVFGVVAHDLQGPVATFDNLTRSMPSMLREARPEEVNSLVRNLHLAAQELQQSLHELMDWAVTQSGSMTFRPEVFSCLKLAEQVVAELRPWAEEHGVVTTLLVPEGVTTFADRAMVRIVLRTLLFNAIRLSGEGQTVTVFSGRKEELITMGVKDHSQGMPSEALAAMLSWDQAERGTSDNGVGIPMCRELVKRNSGELFAESHQGQGNSFYFTLPEHPPAQAEF